MTDLNWREQDIRLYAIFASLFISLLTYLFPYTLNDDAYTYIRTADIFVQQGLAAAYQHYSWATYSVILGLVSKIGFDLFTAGFLVNAVFYAVLVYAFISIVKEISDSRLVVFLAAVVILVYPQINEYRYNIIRDAGFWALAVLGLWQFLLFARLGYIKHAIGFCCALIVATSFRAEAVVYLLITPLALLLDHRFEARRRWRQFWLLEGIVIGLMLTATAVLALNGTNIFSLFAEFISTYQPFLVSTFIPEPEQADAIGGVLFHEHASAYSQEYIAIFMAAGLFAILLANLFNAIGGPYLWVLLYGLISRTITIPRHVAVPIIVYLLVNGLVLLGFLFITRYLTSRYAVLFCLMLTLFVPVVIAAILQRDNLKNRTMVTGFLALFFTYCAIDSFYSFGESKLYVFDAVDWIADNRSDSTNLVTNNNAIAYYSGMVVNYDETMRLLTAAEIQQSRPGDLVAIEINYTMQQLINQLLAAQLLEPLAVFPDNENVRVAIYRRISP